MESEQSAVSVLNAEAILGRMCKTEVRRTPFERLGHKYCSTNCVVAHKAVLGS